MKVKVNLKFCRSFLLTGPKLVSPLCLLLVPPAAEIHHVSNLFQEKQAELQSAVLRVDQVTKASRWSFTSHWSFTSRFSSEKHGLDLDWKVCV